MILFPLYHIMQTAKKVELVEGYGIKITKMQLDSALSESAGSATHLIRHLISTFYSRSELALSSCYGTRHNRALNKEIVMACISKYHYRQILYLQLIVHQILIKAHLKLIQL